MVTGVPGAASVPAPGTWSIAVPGAAVEPGGGVLEKYVPSTRPACSSAARACGTVRPTTLGTVSVGAPALTTSETEDPGESGVPAPGRVVTTTSLGTVVCAERTGPTFRPADTIRLRAKFTS